MPSNVEVDTQALPHRHLARLRNPPAGKLPFVAN
jgi:hypothetical protein